jgi:uncharacterized GH25 family protein
MKSRILKMKLSGILAIPIAAITILYSGPVGAHAFWIVPVEDSGSINTRVVLDLIIGPQWPGVSTARQTGKLISRFDVTDSKGVYPVAGRENARPVGHYTPEIQGAGVVVMTTTPHLTKLSGDEFEKYLKEEGLTGPLKYRERLGISGIGARERFSRVAKALVFVDGSSEGFDRDMNLPFEIIPVTDPLAYEIGSSFHVRVLRNGKDLAGVQVTAMGDRQRENLLRTRTNDDGIASFDIPTDGKWVVYAVDMQSAPDLSVDWESIWTSLTFSLKSRD